MNPSKLKAKFKLKQKKKKLIYYYFRSFFWFITGAFITLVFILFFGFFTYERFFEEKIFQGVTIENKDFGGKSKKEIIDFYSEKNKLLDKTTFTLNSDYGIATLSAKEIEYGYDINLLTEQAYLLGRSKNFVSDFSIVLQAYFLGINLKPSYKLNIDKLTLAAKSLSEKINKPSVNAVFKYQKGRVSTFIPSRNGQEIDFNKLNKLLLNLSNKVVDSPSKNFSIKIPIIVLEPEITTEKANNLGIKELIGEGHSFFYHSIPGRIHNVNLASTRVNGILVAPGETFSFNKILGDVSAFTGYKQAYIIQNGKTVLGDGGGVCQVSTTLFRAILNAGLPIMERHAHAYRVGYYEEASPPGIDATVFYPSVDFKFKNDTGHHILIQSVIGLNNLSLSYFIYGTNDGRLINISTPTIWNQSPPPPPVYTDDPNLPKGEIKQTDFAAWGASVFFTREVKKNSKIIISERFTSVYKPWQATFLKGTKE